MKKSKIPKMDSIQKSAEFWDTHDATDFAHQMEEVTTPVFVRENAIEVRLYTREAKAVAKLAEGKDVSREELIRGWVLQKLKMGNGTRRTSPRSRR